MATACDKNILVISDLHLGEALRPTSADVAYLRHLAKLERELANFLEYHTCNRLDERPWQLVINGDMVDFLAVKIMPEEESGGEVVEAEDKLYGLGFGEIQSQKKLEKIIVRHQQVFGKLAEFVKAGNDLVIVVGNHDVEFQYESVQTTLVEWLCGLAHGAGAEEAVRAAYRSRIEFCPWFFYREDLVYIEHGHQYDEYCSFDYFLQPGAQRRGGTKSRVALSIAHAGMRYFANQLPHYDPHTAETWGVVKYVAWAFAQGLRGAIRLCYFYGLFVWRVVEVWYTLRGRAADEARRKVHGERLRALSTAYAMAEDKLVALHALRQMPVTKRFFKMLSALFLDRVILGGFCFGAVVGLATWSPGWSRLWAPLVVIASLVGVNLLLSHFRLESSSVRLRRAPEMIRRLVSAPLIVFGHSHNPEVIDLPDGGRYINTGTWASDEEDHAFTHLLVQPAAAPKEGEREPSSEVRAELRQWKNGISAPYRRVA